MLVRRPELVDAIPDLLHSLLAALELGPPEPCGVDDGLEGFLRGCYVGVSVCRSMLGL